MGTSCPFFMKQMTNLFGKGFIGSHYSLMYDCIVNERNDLVPKSSVILYMISTTDNYNIHTNPYVDIDTNLTTLIRVLENCKNKDIVFNFVSSWAVYGDVESPYTETSYCNPKGFYPITKRTAEQLLMSYCETFNIKYRILRLANVIGPGDLKASTKKNVLTHLTREIKKGNDITIYNNGEIYRDYIHVKDACVAINLILEKGELNSIYNVGNGKSTMFRDAIDYVLSKTNSSTQINNVVQEGPYAREMVMDTTKLQSLGYCPKYSIEMILDELIIDV